MLAVAVAYHKGAAAARDATALRDARATIAHQEAVSRRNEEAAYTAQYNAAVRAADNEDLQRRLDAYAAELKTQSEASVARRLGLGLLGIFVTLAHPIRAARQQCTRFIANGFH